MSTTHAQRRRGVEQTRSDGQVNERTDGRAEGNKLKHELVGAPPLLRSLDGRCSFHFHFPVCF